MTTKARCSCCGAEFEHIVANYTGQCDCKGDHCIHCQKCAFHGCICGKPVPGDAEVTSALTPEFPPAPGTEGALAPGQDGQGLSEIVLGSPVYSQAGGQSFEDWVHGGGYMDLTPVDASALPVPEGLPVPEWLVTPEDPVNGQELELPGKTASPLALLGLEDGSRRRPGGIPIPDGLTHDMLILSDALPETTEAQRDESVTEEATGSGNSSESGASTGADDGTEGDGSSVPGPTTATKKKSKAS